MLHETQREIQEPCSIKDGVFCDNNKTLEIISDKEGFEDQPLKRL